MHVIRYHLLGCIGCGLDIGTFIHQTLKKNGIATCTMGHVSNLIMINTCIAIHVAQNKNGQNVCYLGPAELGQKPNECTEVQNPRRPL